MRHACAGPLANTLDSVRVSAAANVRANSQTSDTADGTAACIQIAPETATGDGAK